MRPFLENTPYRLVRFLAGMPPEILGGGLLLALERPDLIIAAVSFVLSAVAGNIVVWLLGAIFAVYMWTKVPLRLRHDIRKAMATLLPSEIARYLGIMSSGNPESERSILEDRPRFSSARDYFETVRRRYEEYRAEARKNENQLAVMRYYTPAGQEIRVLNVSLQEGSETLLLRGEYLGPAGVLAPCDIVLQPQGAQLVLSLVTFAEPPPEPERRPVGFRIEPERTQE